MDRRIARLDVWLEEKGGPALEELRKDAEISRISLEHQLALTRRLVERALPIFERVEAALDENTRETRSLRRQLEGGGDGPGSGDA